MKRFVVIVLDGFGIGEMPDVSKVRPNDVGSNTCKHIFDELPNLKLPTLEKLGLFNAAEIPFGKDRKSKTAVFGRSLFTHFGADTFFAHQEIMGTNPKMPFMEPFKNKILAAEEALIAEGYNVKRYQGRKESLLIVNNAATIGDNIETDLGQAFNVTAAIDQISFEKVLDIGEIVRRVSIVPRIIAFGGRNVGINNLLDAVEEKGEFVGVNAPKSGVYNNDYHCVHLGYGVDSNTQVPYFLAKKEIQTFLVGKAADIIINSYGESYPIVSTTEVMDKTIQLVQDNEIGFFCSNVQETDLSGHSQDTKRYGEVLTQADKGLARLIKQLGKEDILVVMADHGNDPTIGHSMHTREMVPLLIYSTGVSNLNIGTRKTLSDVGASVCDYFSAQKPENGQSFLPLLKIGKGV